jgi:hypothetical protein
MSDTTGAEESTFVDDACWGPQGAVALEALEALAAMEDAATDEQGLLVGDRTLAVVAQELTVLGGGSGNRKDGSKIGRSELRGERTELARADKRAGLDGAFGEEIGDLVEQRTAGGRANPREFIGRNVRHRDLRGMLKGKRDIGKRNAEWIPRFRIQSRNKVVNVPER